MPGARFRPAPGRRPPHPPWRGSSSCRGCCRGARILIGLLYVVTMPSSRPPSRRAPKEAWGFRSTDSSSRGRVDVTSRRAPSARPRDALCLAAAVIADRARRSHDAGPRAAQTVPLVRRADGVLEAHLSATVWTPARARVCRSIAAGVRPPRPLGGTEPRPRRMPMSIACSPKRSRTLLDSRACPPRPARRRAAAGR